MTDIAALGHLLHQEHLHTLAVLNDVETRLAGARGRPFDVNDPRDRSCLDAFVAMIERDIVMHYRFEEEVLFPRLDEVGLGSITALLVQEHDAVRSMTDVLHTTLDDAFARGFGAATWTCFREGVMDLVHSVSFHIQKEEMGVIRQMAIVLGDEADRELGALYLARAEHDEA